MTNDEMMDLGMLIAIDREIKKEEEKKDIELNPKTWSIN